MTEVKKSEMAGLTFPSEGIIQLMVPDEHDPNKQDEVTLRRLARNYDDALTIYVRHGDYEQWKFLNLGGPTHPMHIHLTAFQALSRDRFITNTFVPYVEGNPQTGGTSAPLTFLSREMPAPNEQGWKDTIRVGRRELVSVVGKFSGGNGRFMYHCHLIDHEDHGMMRPFNVRPPEVLDLMPHGEHGEHHP